MLKKIFFIIFLLNLLSHCDYKPLYSKQNKVNYKIIISSFSGDKDINNTIAKNSAGTITDYQSDVVTTFVITKENISENFVVSEKFNFKKMTDKYEERNYEQNIKKNIANSISQKIILRLAVIE